jgi:hypothetical protein
MDRVQKIDCGVNGEVIFTGATAKFQLKKGLTPFNSGFHVLVQFIPNQPMNIIPFSKSLQHVVSVLTDPFDEV